MAQLAAIILAAGKGTRMKSAIPKVLHHICGQPMVKYVLDAACGAGVKQIIAVVGHEAEQVKASLPREVLCVVQEPQLGTGHAVRQAIPHLEGDHVLVLCGDTPLLRGATLHMLYDKHIAGNAPVTLLTALIPRPRGYGRIKRSPDGTFLAIVEEKDATPEEKEITEINTGVYCFRKDALINALEKISPDNAQGEYYLTDTLGIIVNQGKTIDTVLLENWAEVSGINDRVQLADAASVIRNRILEDLMKKGVTVIDPVSTYIDATVDIAADTVIFPQTFIEGKTKIGSCSQIGPACRITDSNIGQEVKIQYSVVLEANVSNNCTVGPFAYLRPGTNLSEDVKIGDFVEIKNTRIGPGSKVPHLSYVGDAVVGKNVNIGAGTITCNYDGSTKSTTIIGDNAFIGSNTNLVAPLEVGERAVTAAGSTITKKVAPGALAIERARQKNVAGWDKRKREK